MLCDFLGTGISSCNQIRPVFDEPPVDGTFHLEALLQPDFNSQWTVHPAHADYLRTSSVIASENLFSFN